MLGGGRVETGGWLGLAGYRIARVLWRDPISRKLVEIDRPGVPSGLCMHTHILTYHIDIHIKDV